MVLNSSNIMFDISPTPWADAESGPREAGGDPDWGALTAVGAAKSRVVGGNPVLPVGHSAPDAV